MSGPCARGGGGRRGPSARAVAPLVALAASAVLAAAVGAAAAALLRAGRRPDASSDSLLPPPAREAARRLDALGLPDPDDPQARFSVPSMFGEARVFSVVDDDGEALRVLGVEGTVQSATYLGERCADLPFGYLRAFDRALGAGGAASRVLAVGGGGCSYPKHVLAARPGSRVDVVEVDPTMLALAWRFFFLEKAARDCGALDGGRLGLVCADGRAYLDDLAQVLSAPAGTAERGRLAARGRGRYGACFGEPYDVVALDAFGAGSHARGLMSVGAARSIRGCLRPGGALVANVVAAAQGPGAGPLRSYMGTLGEVFAHVWAVPLGQGEELLEPDNVVVLATDADRPAPAGACPVDPEPGD